MTRPRTEVAIINDHLRKHIVGVKLVAYEMSEEVACARGLLQQGKHDEIGARLTRLDELIEPLMKAVNL